MHEHYHEQKCKQYSLIVSYLSSKLIIILETQTQTFQNILHDDSFPKDVQRAIGKGLIVFQLLKNKQSRMMDLVQGRIFLRRVLEVSGNKKQKNATLYLQPAKHNEWKTLFVQIEQIRVRLGELEQQQKIEKIKEMEMIGFIKTQIKSIYKLLENLESRISLIEFEIHDLQKQQKKREIQKERKWSMHDSFQFKLRELQMEDMSEINTHDLDSIGNDEGKQFYDIQTPFASQFLINGQRITYQGQDRVTTQFLLSKVIKKRKKTEVSFKVVKTKYQNILIGIVDRIKQRKERKSNNSGNAVCYFGSNGIIIFGKTKEKMFKKQGIGFRQGEIVKMIVSLKNRNIKWVVNSQIRAEISLLFLEEEERQFVPYIEMRNKGDIVQYFV